MEGRKNKTVWVLAMGGIGELSGVPRGSDIGIGNTSNHTGKMGLVSSGLLGSISRIADDIGILMRESGITWCTSN